MTAPLLNIVRAGQATTHNPEVELFSNYPDMLSVEQFSEAWGISKQSAWAMCRRGDVPNVKVGKRVFIPRDLLSDFVKDIAYGTD